VATASRDCSPAATGRAAGADRTSAAAKQIEVNVPPPGPPEPRSATPGRTEVALADDPTIKSLTAKLVDNRTIGGALPRGQVYASRRL